MQILWTILGVAAVLAVAVLTVTYICYRMAFYLPRGAAAEKHSILDSKAYKPFRETIAGWMQQMRELPYEECSIRTFDGLMLRGKYYEYKKGAPIELMFHGYRGSAERDLCGGIQRCFAAGRSALIVDQRGCGGSEGRTATFGVKESRDCLVWVNFMIDRFGADVKILLTGISMGAATVMMAAGNPLPDNVIGVLADCGYTSARDIIQTVIRRMKLPVKLIYPFVKLGARIYGGFRLEETPPIEALKRCRVPVFFVHGEADDFVPCDMSRRNYEVCPSRKMLLTVPGAGHGLSYPVDPEGYLRALGEFFDAPSAQVSE